MLFSALALISPLLKPISDKSLSDIFSNSLIVFRYSFLFLTLSKVAKYTRVKTCPTFSKSEYEIQRGPKLTLSDKIFEFALNDYWSKQNNQIVTFEKLMYDFGSPGKVFQLDERSMEFYLEKLENEGKNFIFNRGAGGLRQISKIKQISEIQLLKNCYKKVA